MKPSLVRCCLGICTTFSLLFGVLGVASTEAALTCEIDVDGPNDVPNQKDLTRFCIGTASDLRCAATFDFGINWNWDDTGLTGTNTGDACALFDTDGDGNANFALCVTIGGNPATQLSGVSPRLYTCGDTRPDRCTSPILQITSFNSTCSVDFDTAPPFSPSASCKGASCATQDTRATCCIDLADFGDPTQARLLDTCSYPSQQPNSDPSDCIVKQQCHTAADCTAEHGQCQRPTCGTDSICRYPIDTTLSCDDGNACTVADHCNEAGECVGAEKTCPTPDQCHLAGTCDASTGACSNQPAPNGTTCTDGNACTQTDTCQSGTCVGGDPVVCSALDQCHDAGTCNTTTGVCSNPNKTNGTTCNDGNACTQTDSCQSGTCVGGNPVVCAALDQCHDPGTCDSATGQCSNPAKAENAPCSDGNACTVGDKCVAGVCQPGTTVNNIPGTGAACDQSHPCATGEQCVNGVCQSGPGS